ncbi:MAG: anti-sigma factor family protein [Pirellulaceae bacterium]
MSAKSLPPESVQQSLCDLLDGRLPPSQREAVERLIAEDPIACDFWKAIRAQRQALKRVPVRRLPADFQDMLAKRLSEVEGRALEVLPTDPPAPTVRPASNPSGRSIPGWVWGSMIAAAATVAFVAVRWRPESPLKGQLGVVGSSDPQASDGMVPGNSLRRPTVESVAKGSQEVNAKELLQSTLPKNSAAQADAAKGEIAMADRVEPSKADAGDSGKKPPIEGLAEAPAVPKIEPDGIPSDLGQQLGSQFLMVYDISVDDQALDANVLEEIFERNDIAFEDPVKVDPEEVDLLKTLKVIGPGKPKSSESVGLIFVKARAERLDRAMGEVWDRHEDFPEASFDMAIDPPAMVALQELKSIEEFGEFEPGLGATDQRADGVARPFLPPAPGGPDAWSQFVGVERRAKPESTARRHLLAQRRKVSQALSEAMNPVAYALLIVRPAPDR